MATGTSPAPRIKTARAAARWWRWCVVLVPGALLYLAPAPGLTAMQRHLSAVFLATIISLVVQPVPMGVSVLLAITFLALTGTLPASRVLTGFSNTTVWLIFTAFLFARAVTATRFGLRVAYLFIRRFGHSALTLGYSLAASGLVLAPFVPSDTARGGGIVFPIARSLAQAFDSEPGETAGRLGNFLMLVSYHSGYICSAMFLTSMAANPLVAEFAHKVANADLTWGRWALAASVPGLLSLIAVPWVIYRLYPPEIRNTEAARSLARAELRKMGRMRREERWVVAILLAVMAGWVTSPWHAIPNAFVALGGLSAILLTGVLSWQDLLTESKAWDALVWFAGLIMMADALQESGVIAIVSGGVFPHVRNLPWPVVLVVLVAMYLYVHYAFASMTAHLTALYSSFLAAAVLAGAPPLLAALPLAFFSSLDACLTHYGTGSAPVYFGAGYVSQARWWQAGFLMSLVYLLIWLGVGLLWWKAIGIW